MQVPLMNGIFASAALLVGVLRTVLNVPMFSHSRAVLSKQFQTTGPLNNRLSLPNFKFYLQYSSQILKHLCDFPLPQCWFGYYSRLSAPKYAWLNIGEGKGHIWVRARVSGVNVRNLEKIQDKWLLFQRFVTSIVGTSINFPLRLESAFFMLRQPILHVFCLKHVNS